MIKTSNQKARQYVEARIVFKGSNTFSENTKTAYKVYSYGYHFPLFVRLYGPVDQWYENADGYSQTTAKHKNQLRPSNLKMPIIKLSTQEMINL